MSVHVLGHKTNLGPSRVGEGHITHLLSETLLLEDVKGCLLLSRDAWIKAKFSNHVFDLNVSLVLKSFSKFIDALRSQFDHIVIFGHVKLSELELLEWSDCAFADCRLQVQVDALKVLGRLSFIIDFQVRDCWVVSVPWCHARDDQHVVEQLWLLATR